MQEESSSNTSSHARDGTRSVFGDSGELATLNDKSVWKWLARPILYTQNVPKCYTLQEAQGDGRVVTRVKAPFVFSNHLLARLFFFFWGMVRDNSRRTDPWAGQGLICLYSVTMKELFLPQQGTRRTQGASTDYWNTTSLHAYSTSDSLTVSEQLLTRPHCSTWMPCFHCVTVLTLLLLMYVINKTFVSKVELKNCSGQYTANML